MQIELVARPDACNRLNGIEFVITLNQITRTYTSFYKRSVRQESITKYFKLKVYYSCLGMGIFCQFSFHNINTAFISECYLRILLKAITFQEKEQIAFFANW